MWRGCQQQNVTSYSHWQRSITLTSFVFRRHTSMTTTSTSPTSSQSQVSTSSTTHSTPNMDVRHMFTTTSLMLCVCRRLHAAISFVWADITLPTSANHQLNTGTTQICHQSFLILQSWFETLRAIIWTGDIGRLI